MSDIKVSGIVLSSFPSGDKDSRIVLLTREMGKVTVLVKGALSPNSKWRSVAQPFCCGNYVLTSGHAFYYIKEADLGDSLYELRSDLDRYAWASLMLEVGGRFSLEGEDNRQLVNLLVRGLLAMARSELNPPEVVASAFILRVLADSGFQGDWTRCPYCGREVGGDKPWGFKPEDGTLVCPFCESTHPTLFLLSKESLDFWKKVEESGEKEIFSVQASPQSFTEIKRAATAFLEYQSEERFKSLEFLRNMGT